MSIQESREENGFMENVYNEKAMHRVENVLHQDQPTFYSHFFLNDLHMFWSNLGG